MQHGDRPSATPSFLSGFLPARVEGEALVLRQWAVTDAEAMAEVIHRNIDHLRPWMPWIAQEPLSLSARRLLIEAWTADRAAGGDAVYAIVMGGAIVGGCGLHRRIGPAGVEVGYWTSVDHLRQGVASTSSRLLTTAALALPEISVVEIHHDRANVASGAVPRRLGFDHVDDVGRDPLAPAETGTLCVWRMTEARWSTRGSCPQQASS